MHDTTELKSIISDYSLAIICLCEVLKQTERLEADTEKQDFPGIQERKDRLEKAINRMGGLYQTYAAALRQAEKENAEEAKRDEEAKNGGTKNDEL